MHQHSSLHVYSHLHVHTHTYTHGENAKEMSPGRGSCPSAGGCHWIIVALGEGFENKGEREKQPYSWVVVAHTFPGISEFKTSLLYKMSFRTAWVTQENLISKKKPNKQTNKQGEILIRFRHSARCWGGTMSQGSEKNGCGSLDVGS